MTAYDIESISNNKLFPSHPYTHINANEMDFPNLNYEL